VNPAAVAIRRELDGALGVYAPLIRLLDEVASMLVRVTPPAYTARPLLSVSGSIGEHVRHVLDHVAAFAAARHSQVLSYDRRERGTALETDSGAALRAIVHLKAVLTNADGMGVDEPILVSAILSRGGEPMPMRSTLRRELAFVVSHTIHHQALIAVLLAITGSQVPDAFGLSPSTPRLAGS
jgi:uncharacterized damage-inducible protein DinB